MQSVTQGVGLKLVFPAGMLCSTCQSLGRQNMPRLRGLRPRPAWQINFVPRDSCELCGAPAGCPEPSDGVNAKASRLARFGLAAGGRPLLRRSRPDTADLKTQPRD